MPVYVDQPIHPFGRMLMCHMWADTEAELLEMVDTIGVSRRWIQQPPKASWLHFDIAKSKRALAIRGGAIETDRYGPVEHLARINLTSGNPEVEARAERRLKQIVASRRRSRPQAELPL